MSKTAPRTRRHARSVPRVAVATLAAVAFLAVTHRAALAQTSSVGAPRWEALVPSGKLIPTGAQQDAIQRAGLTALQLTRVIRPSLALTTTLGWARSRDIVAVGHPKLDVFMADFGAEARAPQWFADHRVTFRPFAGVGAGVRSYNYRSLQVDATHNLSAYGSMGGEVGFSRVRVRLEARNYITGFEPLDGTGPADTRNDVVVMAGIRLVSR